MKQNSDRSEMSVGQIKQHLKSAVDALTPDVLDQVDLSAAQELSDPNLSSETDGSQIRSARWMRGFAMAAAACACVALVGSGIFFYQRQNQKVDSVIGLDVNPSLEISINRRSRVLNVKTLNLESETIMQGVDLQGMDLNVAVNTVIGSMVTFGYLDERENAILVTVSNDSVSKASELRSSVVSDIEAALEANQVQAIVYGQQAVEDDEAEKIAGRYDISYGKAYFLKELIGRNEELSMADMDALAVMNMEEIAEQIDRDSYELGEVVAQAELTNAEEAFSGKETENEESVSEEIVDEKTVPDETKESEHTSEPVSEPETAPPTRTGETEDSGPIEPGQVEIDYVDYEDGIVYVYFENRVKWKNPTVSVRDEAGNPYAAIIGDTSSEDCTIEVEGLTGGKSYVFVLNGLISKETDTATTVVGYFDKPEIAWEAESGGSETEPAASDAAA